MWFVLGAIVIVMLAIDLFVFARGHVPPIRESILWSVVWVAAAVLFGAVFWATDGSQKGSEFFAGYLLERSLSLDNIFVFAIILGYFKVAELDRAKVLGWGIGLALALRLVFILAGAALLDAFHVTFYLFGALLLYTAWKLIRHAGEEADPSSNVAVKLVRRVAPGASPLVAVFLVIAVTDILFAVDSIPAIFAITRDSYIVFAANAFAMLGLRALYFLLVGLMDRFVYLTQGLSVILAFIGVKMMLIDVWHVPIWLSLGVIVGVLAATAALSLRKEALA